MASRLILDSGAIIALAAREDRALRYLDFALRNRVLVIVPAVVIAETTRGGNEDAPINPVVNRLVRHAGEIAPVTERVARVAGRLL